MSQIHIIDGQEDVILDFITEDNIINDNHRRSMEDSLETYDFITFADRRFSEFLAKRNRLIIPDEDGTLREFVIFEAHKYQGGDGHRAEVYANASYLELKKASILYPSTYTGGASQHGGRALNNTGWQMGIVENSGTRTLTIENHTNPYEYLKRVAREFGLELRFRIEHDGNKVIGRYVDMLVQVGIWQGREAEFGKDLEGIRRIEKQDIVTALLGIGPEDEEGNRLEVLVEDEDALQRWGRVDEHGNLHHLIEPYEIQSSRSEMTEEEARQYTRTALDKRINTQVTYEGLVVDLENVPGMENKKIRFGDTIKLKDTKFNPPLYLEARVFEQIRSIKFTERKQIKLGDYIERTEEEVNAIWKTLQAEIRKKISMADLRNVTYLKDEIDDKEEALHTEVTHYADTVSGDAEENAKEYARQYADAQDATTKQEVNQYTQQQIQAVEQALLEDLDGRIGDVSGSIDDLNTTAQGLIDRANATDELLGIHGGKISTFETEIDDIEGRLSASITKVEGIEGTVTSHSNTLTAQADLIEGKLDSLTYTQDKAGIIDRIEANETNIQATADGLEVRVTKEEFEGLVIGGRNLIPDSNNFRNFVRSGVQASFETVEVPEWNVTDATKIIAGGTSDDRRLTSNIEGTSGFIGIYSLYVKNVGTNTIRIATNGWFERGNVNNTFTEFIEPGENKRIVFVGEARTEYDFFQVHFNDLSSGTMEVILWGEQLEKGDRVSDWSPAPEDIDSRVTSTETTLDIHAGLIEAKAEKSEIYNRTTIDGFLGNKLDTSTYTNQIAQFNLKFDGIDAFVQNTQLTLNDLTGDMTSALSQISTIEQTAGRIEQNVSEIRADFDGMEIGGRNLLRDSSLTHSGNGAWTSLPDRHHDDDYVYVEQGYSWGVRQIVPFLKAGTYTISVMAKEGTSHRSRVRFSNTYIHNQGITSEPLTSEWKRVHLTFTLDEDVTDFNIYFLNGDQQDNAPIKMAQFKLEKGNRPTDWSPAPEDIVSETVESVGKWTKTYSVNVSSSMELTEIYGQSFDDRYSYKVSAKTLSTAVETSATVIFKANASGGNGGAGWSIVKIYERDTRSNHPEFFLDGGKPSIRLYAHTSIYPVEVTHEKFIGSETTETRFSSRITSAESSITTMANQISLKASQTEVNTLTGKIDGLQIGGRNHFSVSSYLVNTPTDLYDVDDKGALIIKDTDNTGDHSYPKIADLEPNSSYVMSFSEGMNQRFNLRDSGGNTISFATSSWDGDKIFYFTTPNNVDHIVGKFFPTNTNYPRNVFVKLEKGNRPTDWSPAPEDQFHNIQVGGRNLIAESTITKGRYIQDNGTHVTSASWAVTPFIPVDGNQPYIASGYSNLGSAPSTVFYDSSQTYISGIRNDNSNGPPENDKRRLVTTPNNARYMRFSFHLNDLSTIKLEKGNKATDWTPAPEDVDARISSTEAAIDLIPGEIDLRVSSGISALEIGGRNLLTNSTDTYRNANHSQWYATLRTVTLSSLGLKVGDTVTFSVYVKTGSAGGARARLRWEDNSNVNITNHNGTEIGPNSEGKVVATGTIPSGATRVRLALNNVNNSNSYTTQFKEEQLERGSKATDWSPAPEDHVYGTNVVSSINLSTEGIRISGDKIQINGQTTFASNYDPSTKETPSGAQSKASAAQSAAISAAASDASSKASAAQSAAISAAASDATSKANSARDTAIRYTDDNIISLVKNPELTGSHTGWHSGNVTTVMDNFQGQSIRVLRNHHTTNTITYSQWFRVDPSKAYEVSIWVRKNASRGRYYFGLHGGTDGESNNLAFTNVGSDGSSSSSTNFYFWAIAGVSTSWVKLVGYMMPSGTNPSDMANMGTSRNAIMAPNLKYVRVRMLNYENGGTTTYMYMAHPKVVEVDPNAIIRGTQANNLTSTWRYSNTTEIDGGNIRTGTLAADKITTGTLRAIDIESVNINGANIVASGYHGEVRITDTGGIFLGNGTNLGRKTYIYNSAIHVSDHVNSTEVPDETIAIYPYEIDFSRSFSTVRTAKIRMSSTGELELYPMHNTSNNASISFGINSSNQMYIRTTTSRIQMGGQLEVSVLHFDANVDISEQTSNRSLRINNNYGYADFGARNTSTFHMDTDRPSFYMYKPLNVHSLTVRGTSTYSGNQTFSGGLTVSGGQLNTDAVDINSGTHLYTRPSSSGELRVTTTGTTGTYRPIRVSTIYLESGDSVMRTSGDLRVDNTGTGYASLASQNSIVYLQAGGDEVRVTNWKSSGSYKPIRASGFPTGSLSEFKQDIEEWKGSALDVIRNTTLYNYRLKVEVEKNPRARYRQGLVIGKGYSTPEVFVDGDGVEQYLLNTWNMRAIQELDVDVKSIKDEINWLKLENQYLRQRIEKLSN